MGIVAIDDLEDPRVAPYRNVKDRDLSRDLDAFLVEGAGAIRQLIERSRFEPESLLLSPRALASLEPALARLAPDTPIYVAKRADYHDIVGFDLHRGCLALCRRRREPALRELLDDPSIDGRAPLLVLEGITNHDNVGGLFRNARAFGAGAVVLCPTCCDPLYRKAIRTSIGASLELPFARASSWPGELLDADVPIVALHPGSGGVDLAEWSPPPGRFALVVGTEGPGLSLALAEAADVRLRIGMEPGIDSINVALAAGIALHHVRALRHRSGSRGGPESDGRAMW